MKRPPFSFVPSVCRGPVTADGSGGLTAVAEEWADWGSAWEKFDGSATDLLLRQRPLRLSRRRPAFRADTFRHGVGVPAEKSGPQAPRATNSEKNIHRACSLSFYHNEVS